MKIKTYFFLGFAFILSFGIIFLVSADFQTNLPKNATSDITGSGYMTEGTHSLITYTLLTDACIEQVNSSNQIRCLENEGTAARDAYFLVNWTTPAGTINSVMLTGEGNSTATSSNCTLSAWNYTKGSWTPLNKAVCSTGVEVTVNFNLSNSGYITDYISGNKIQMLFWANSSTVTDDLQVDFLKADIAYTPSTDTCTYGGAGQWDITCSDNCNFATTQTIGTTNNIVITGTGTLTFNNGGIWAMTGTNQYITIAQGCTLNINKGGGINA